MEDLHRDDIVVHYDYVLDCLSGTVKLEKNPVPGVRIHLPLLNGKRSELRIVENEIQKVGQLFSGNFL